MLKAAYTMKKAIVWGYEKGIVSGISNTAFAPDQKISREQLVSMLYRYRDKGTVLLSPCVLCFNKLVK